MEASPDSFARAEESDVPGRAPVLVVLPDPEARTPVERRLLGRPPLARLVEHALASGFSDALLAPGTTLTPTGARAVATGEWLDRPALIVFEGTCVHPSLLPLMVEHPLDRDERFTLYDALGRPAACFVGHLRAMPAVMPVTEELPWPEGFGPPDVVRVVYPEDLERGEALVLRVEGITGRARSWWRDSVDAHTLRWLTRSARPLPQLQLLAWVLGLGALPISLIGGGPALWLGATSLLLGVHVSRALPRVRVLRGEPTTAESLDDDRWVAAIRPLCQSAYMGGLTYRIVAETDRSGVAALVLLAAGAAAVLLGLVHTRSVLRGRPSDVFALPDAHALARRLHIRWPAVLDGAPFVELVIWLAAMTGIAELPWSALLATGLGRLWRWFSGPDDLFPRFRENEHTGASSGALR